MVVENPMSCTLKIRGGREVDSYGKKAGKGPLVQWERSATLGVTQDQTLFVWRETAQDHPIGGNGYIEGEIMYTLNSTEVHSVCITNYKANGDIGGV